MCKTFNPRQRVLCVAMLILFVFGISIPSYAQSVAGPAERVDRPSTTGGQEQSKCCSYWGATMLLGSKEYAATNVFCSQRCDIYDDHVLKYVTSIIGKPDNGSFGLQCKDTREEVEKIVTPPAGSGYRLVKQWTIPDDPAFGGGGSSGITRSTSRANSESKQNSSDTDDSERANERTRLFNQQNGRSSTINPDGTQSAKLVRREGESEEDFRARERAALFNAQKNSKIAPDGSVDSAWTEANAKKYTQGKKGHWAVASFKATAWCADKMFMATGYVDACVVNASGSGSFKGTFLRIQNSSDNYPVYYGLSGVLNKKLEPHQIYTEDLAMYVPIDPAKRAKMPDTVVEILVKYWVEDK